MRKKASLISLITTLIVGGILYYIFIPAINIQSYGFIIFVSLIISLYYLTYLTISSTYSIKEFFNGIEQESYKKIHTRDKSYKLILIIPCLFIITIIVNFILSPIFDSKSYYERITVNKDSEFSNDIKEVDFNKIPLLDRDSSEKLGDRTMGQMSDLVSQFDVSYQYTQINYNDEIMRVTPLEYNGIIKYFMNRKKGVTGYITVDSTNGNSKLVKLDKGMRYMPSAHFNENLYRKLRFSYPTSIFDEAKFEIDNEGNPYWIVPVVKYAGFGLRKDIKEVVIFNPIDGSSKKYKVNEVPSWVDNVYSSDLIIEQVNDWGQYSKGFINSIFGQKDVVQTTTGYNYLVMNDDVYLYTGITSVVSDESNIGFILSNLRTKETKYYAVPGAEEYSAMDSAEGQVQQMSYKSTFPLLVNLNNRPTYLISLKDNAGFVKMYAFVDVVDYQKVVVTDASNGIEKAAENYLNNIVEIDNNSSNMESKTIMIKSIKEVIIDGNSYYYIEDYDNNKYKVSIKTNKDLLPFISINDKVTINYTKLSNVTTIKKIEK